MRQQLSSLAYGSGTDSSIPDSKQYSQTALKTLFKSIQMYTLTPVTVLHTVKRCQIYIFIFICLLLGSIVIAKQLIAKCSLTLQVSL